MKRNVSLEEISDGRLYDKNDMVRAGCGDCKGCSACCHGMGESIILDPYDLWRLTVNLGVTANELLQEKLELHVVDGMILPNLRMNPTTSACGFLDKEGRCSIMHIARGFAGCSRWDATTKIRPKQHQASGRRDIFAIFCRCMNVRCRIRRR